MNDTVINMLGIAKKAGFLEIGEDSVCTCARNGKAKLVLSACDASENSRRTAGHYAENGGAEYALLPYSKFDLSAVIGRGSPGMLAVTDIGIAASFMNKLSAAHPDNSAYAECAQAINERAQRIAKRKADGKNSGTNIGKGKRRTI